MLHVSLTVVFVGVALVGCGKNVAPNDRADNPQKEADENAIINDALKARLEALGYTQPEAKKTAAPQKENPYSNADLAHFMEGIEATFVFLDVDRDIRLVHNEKRAKSRFSPYSTFKIPNTLIALEVGSADGPDMKMKWDQKAYPKQDWWDALLKTAGYDWAEDHTLKTAFQNSCVWYYKELAKKTGSEKMQAYLDKFDYGDKDISSGIDSFWLGGSLEISAHEQVEFLKRLAQNRLGLSEKTMRDGFAVFERERREGAVLYAKTGGGETIGWFVGIVENKGKKYVFAFNMDGSFAETAVKRIEVPLQILQELGVWF